MTEPAFISLLSIAGSDCSGGAGIQADIKTCCAFGVYAATAVTAVTTQTFSGVREMTDGSGAAAAGCVRLHDTTGDKDRNATVGGMREDSKRFS